MVAFASPNPSDPMLHGLAYVLTTDGKQRPIQPADGRAFTLAEMQGYVGGHIETVRLYGDPNRLLVVDEEGLLKGKPLNHMATLMAGQAIVGDAMLIHKDQID